MRLRRQIWLRDKVEPPNWVLGDMCQAEGYKGVIFRSAIVQGGLNLVVFSGSLQAGDLLEVYDPEQQLPNNCPRMVRPGPSLGEQHQQLGRGTDGRVQQREVRSNRIHRPGSGGPR